MTERFPTLAMGGLRIGIDAVDDGLVVLLAARRGLVRLVADAKRRAGNAAYDGERERRVHARARTLAARLHVPAETVRGVLDVAIADAHRQQVGDGRCIGVATGQGDHVAAAERAIDVDQCVAQRSGGTIAAMDPTATLPPTATRLLRLLPPPSRLAPLLRLAPKPVLRRLLEAAMARVLDAPVREGSLDFMQGRRLGIEVSDLDFSFVVEQNGTRLRIVDALAEASVRGSATDLLLLASRLEDADTLFFQRRLMLTGDTELGLTARNLLDRLPWEGVPLALRIALNRAARFARAARAARQDGF